MIIFCTSILLVLVYMLYLLLYISGLFSSLCQRQCELLPSLGVHRLSSVNFSHFNLLLWNRSAKWKWNLVGSIYGRSSLKFAHLSRSINKHGCHRQFLFLIGRFFKIFSSETAWPNEQKHGRSSIKIAHSVPIR